VAGAPPIVTVWAATKVGTAVARSRTHGRKRRRAFIGKAEGRRGRGAVKA